MDKTNSCPQTLKHLAMRKIISSHFCLNQIDNNILLLPKSLFKELVEIGPGLVEMPRHGRFNYRFIGFIETEPFHKTLIYDRTYSKPFVIWLQTLHAIFLKKYLPVVVHFLEIYFVVQTDTAESKFRLCTNCFKLYLNVHPTVLNSERYRIKKDYTHKTYVSMISLHELRDKLQSKDNWCNSCRQVPLFQVADYDLCESIVGLTAHNCPKHFPIDDDNDEFIYCVNCYGSGFLTHFRFRRRVDISTFFKKKTGTEKIALLLFY